MRGVQPFGSALGTLLRQVSVSELLGGLAATLALSWFVMVVLKRTIGLPMEVSVLVVPFIVSAGFGVAFGLHLYLDLPLLHAAAALGATLIPLTIVYEQLFGTPG